MSVTSRGHDFAFSKLLISPVTYLIISLSRHMGKIVQESSATLRTSDEMYLMFSLTDVCLYTGSVDCAVYAWPGYQHSLTKIQMAGKYNKTNIFKKQAHLVHI